MLKIKTWVFSPLAAHQYPLEKFKRFRAPADSAAVDVGDSPGVHALMLPK